MVSTAEVKLEASTKFLANICKLFIITISLLLVSCSTSDGESDTAYPCAFPCLAIGPSLSTQTISSSTGGTVEVTLGVSGDLEYVNVDLLQYQSGCNSASIMPGGAVYNLVAGTKYTITITVPAGLPACQYYPNVWTQPVGVTTYSTFGYYWHNEPDVKYHYAETIEDDSGLSHTEVYRTPFDIPILEITP